jgi:hypothetical protein
MTSGVFYRYRTCNIEKRLSSIIYFDYLGYNPKSIKASEYFTSNTNIQPETHDKPPLTEDRLNNDVEIESRRNSEVERKNENILELRENKISANSGTQDVNMNNNGVTPDANENLPSSIIQTRRISLPDYSALSIQKLIKYDKRSNIAYFKDLIIMNHPMVSLFFKISIKEPVYLRLYKLKFYLNMLITINSMLYTDDYIDETQVGIEMVTFF